MKRKEVMDTDNESTREPNSHSWDNPLPQAIIDLLPKRKPGACHYCEDYKAEMEKQLRGYYESIP